MSPLVRNLSQTAVNIHLSLIMYKAPERMCYKINKFKSIFVLKEVQCTMNSPPWSIITWMEKKGNSQMSSSEKTL